MDAAGRASRLLALTDKAAAELASGPASIGLPEGPEGEVKRHLLRQEAENLFLFVVLSVLLEGRPGQDPQDRLAAEQLKQLAAQRVLETRTQARELAKKTLDQESSRRFSARLEASGSEDPFLPYYDSFKNSVLDPAQTPFALFARRVADAHCPPAARASSYERLLTLSALLADELVESMQRL